MVHNIVDYAGSGRVPSSDSGALEMDDAAIAADAGFSSFGRGAAKETVMPRCYTRPVAASVRGTVTPLECSPPQNRSCWSAHRSSSRPVSSAPPLLEHWLRELARRSHMGGIP